MSETIEVEAMLDTPARFIDLDLARDITSRQIVEVVTNIGLRDGVIHPARVGFILKPYSLSEGPLMLGVEEHDRDDPDFVPVRYDFTLYADHDNEVKMDRVEGSVRNKLGALSTHHISGINARELQNYRNRMVADIADFN